MKNNKGFTLVELLAVIAILGLVTSITIPIVSNVFINSKKKSEQVFINDLAAVIEDYITYNTSKFEFGADASGGIPKISAEVEECIPYYSSTTTLTLKSLIDGGFLSGKILNPATKVECNPDSITITIYRDIDMVYYFATSNMDCLEYHGTDGNRTINTLPTTTCTP